MTISLPSKQCFVVDVPKVSNSNVVFSYNYFTTDESKSEVTVKNKTTAQDKIVSSKIPRFVKVSWNKPSEFASLLTSDIAYGRAIQNEYGGSLISDNYDKIINPETFTSFDFVNVCFTDDSMNQKFHNLLTGSMEVLLAGASLSSDVTPAMQSRHIASVLNSNSFDTSLLNSCINNRKLQYGAVFLNDVNKEQSQDFIEPQPINAQLNSKFLSDVFGRAMTDPDCQYAADIASAHKDGLKLRESAISKELASSGADDTEYETIAPNVLEVFGQNSNHRSRIALVGYIVDRFEVTQDGTVSNNKYYCIDNPDAVSYTDAAVRYSATYCYSIRSVYALELPGVDDGTMQNVTVRLLVCSKHETRSYVQCTETVHPPAPANLSFTWLYDKNKLLIHWELPVNSQRDIKKFQVFRRSSVNEPFELIREFEFDDSEVKYDDGETPHSQLVVHSDTPMSLYVDDGFSKQSSYIYTTCSIDAHGLTSNYGEQFRVSFDKFKNTLVKEIISHTGAPKQYPNLYVSDAMYEGTMHFEGAYSKSMKITLNPQFDTVKFRDGSKKKVLSTDRTNGRYVFQFLNVDTVSESSINVTVKDVRSV